MLQIQYCSDLHLEFEENRTFLSSRPIEPVGDILVLAGDISYIDRIYNQDKWFFQYCSDNFSETYYIPGNHEFYHHNDISVLNTPLNERIFSNVRLVHNVLFYQQHVPLVFTSLFSNISRAFSGVINMSVSDFFQIRMGKSQFKIKDFNDIHQKSVEFIKLTLNQLDSPAVIASHHLPSLQCNTEEHRKSNINEAFATDLDWLIDKYSSGILYWIYGHSHRNVPDIKINQTTLLCNQLGYIFENEHTNYKPGKIIRIQ